MRGKNLLIIRLTITTMLVLSLAVSHWPLPSRSAPVAALNLKSASQILSEAKTFDAAIQAINGISSLNLKDDSNSKTIESTLETHVPKLRLVRSKLIAIALNDSTLMNAAKTKLSDQKAADQFAIEVSKDVNAVLKLSGATAVRDRIQSALKADVSRVQSVAHFLKDEAQSMAAILNVAMMVVAVTLIVIALIVSIFTFGAAVGLVVAAVAAGTTIAGLEAAVVSGAAKLAAAATASAGAAAESTADKVAECSKRADSKYRSCKSDALRQWEPGRTLALQACRATWLYEAGKCLATD